MYLSYTDYQNMGGTLDEAAFNAFEFEAECIVNWYTFSRLKKFEPEDYPAELPRVMYALIRYIEAQYQLLFPNGNELVPATTGAVASQSNDGVSISYATLSASNLLTAYKTQLDDIVKRGLEGVVDALGRKLLYRGLYPGE